MEGPGGRGGGARRWGAICTLKNFSGIEGRGRAAGGARGGVTGMVRGGGGCGIIKGKFLRCFDVFFREDGLP
jgi:hypothetical protein